MERHHKTDAVKGTKLCAVKSCRSRVSDNLRSLVNCRFPTWHKLCNAVLYNEGLATPFRRRCAMRVLSDLTKDDCPHLRLVSFRGDVPVKVELVKDDKTYTTYNVDVQEIIRHLERIELECEFLPNTQTASNIVASLRALKDLLPTHYVRQTLT